MYDFDNFMEIPFLENNFSKTLIYHTNNINLTKPADSYSKIASAVHFMQIRVAAPYFFRDRNSIITYQATPVAVPSTL
ncbi:hypothetical protein SAMN04487895_11725 [Paenibacillus sophorae]|uniref:Uncharacterized protein n=1 Tax=Paenibacillus sophorae TaxID=1333845 RepID=A0A1H8UC09_9BACL|nr:hypothetical protein SAMN04487895_11725 [Paenibacillus sophorae]